MKKRLPITKFKKWMLLEKHDGYYKPVFALDDRLIWWSNEDDADFNKMYAALKINDLNNVISAKVEISFERVDE